MTTSHPQTSDHFLERGAVPCSCQPLALAEKSVTRIRYSSGAIGYIWAIFGVFKISKKPPLDGLPPRTPCFADVLWGKTRPKTTTSIPPSWNKRLQQPSRLKSCKPHGPAVSSCHAAPALVIIEHHHNHHQHHNHKSNNRTLITYQNHHNQ